MNRRSFFTKLGLAAASFAILPAATTYGRKWVKTEAIWVPNPQLLFTDINRMLDELNFKPLDGLFITDYRAFKNCQKQ